MKRTHEEIRRWIKDRHGVTSTTNKMVEQLLGEVEWTENETELCEVENESMRLEIIKLKAQVAKFDAQVEDHLHSCSSGWGYAEDWSPQDNAIICPEHLPGMENE